jgi:dihydrofolate synthase/folylpolyglutamate synthase
VAVVHIAGTNGKGSTASFLSSILSSAGHRTGLFTSPHLTEFTERISINGSRITEDQITVLAAEVLGAASPESTFFEIVTAMAYLYFARAEVDLAVIEAGMGGGADATNIAHGILSVITPVSLDHCQYLGDTIAAIAAEKAGIIKPGCPVVVAQQLEAAQPVIAQVALANGSPLYTEGLNFRAWWNGEILSYAGLHTTLVDLRPGIGGRYQSTNAALALCSAELLRESGFQIDDDVLMAGLSSARWPGRMELLDFKGFRVVLDGAHNPAGAAALAASLQYLPRRKIILVIGVMQDKDLEGIILHLAPLADRIVAVAPALERSLASDELANLLKLQNEDVVSAGPVSSGLEVARGFASTDDLIVVCGSLFTVGEARAFLLGEHFHHFRG